VDTSSILVYQAPSLGGGATPETCEDADDGTIILLINNGTPPFTVSWSNGDTGTELDSLMPGIYNVTVADSNGCQTVTVFSVLQSDISCYDPIVYVPNIFTPNGDGTNDILYVRGRGIETMQFIIYDRWGERVFTSEDPEDGWDGTFRGKPMESAVFVWHLKATLSNDESIKWKGTITLIK
jgi:gliding motility-associated-like protein